MKQAKMLEGIPMAGFVGHGATMKDARADLARQAQEALARNTSPRIGFHLGWIWVVWETLGSWGYSIRCVAESADWNGNFSSCWMQAENQRETIAAAVRHIEQIAAPVETLERKGV